MTPDPAFLAKFDTMPVGGYGATFQGRRYRVTKSQFACSRSQKLEAAELGGKDYISFNLYRLASGDSLLKPCEMPAQKVVDFVIGAEVD
ncbi:MAG: hypothetical protein AAFN59_09255 [Pseudomonadota bacterium]